MSQVLDSPSPECQREERHKGLTVEEIAVNEFIQKMSAKLAAVTDDEDPRWYAGLWYAIDALREQTVYASADELIASLREAP